MPNPTIRGRKIRQAAAAFGIALAALTFSTAAQADRGSRGLRDHDTAVHATRDTQVHRNRSDRSIRRDSHAYSRGYNGHHRGRYDRPRVRAGFFPGRHYHPAPFRHGRPVAVRPHRHGFGHGCRIVRHVRFGPYGRKFITKRRVCYGRHGR